MNKKKILSTIVCSAIACSTVFSGCSLVSTNNQKDMEQVIATVDISKSASFAGSELEAYKTAITSTDVIKRDLIAYFLNSGYYYVQQYGYSYADTFELLVNNITQNTVLSQYATLSLLSLKAEAEGASVLNAYLEYDNDIERYEYLLGEDSDEVKVARYNVMNSINTSLDSIEKKIIDEEEATAGTETRTTPGNVDTFQENFYPKTATGELDFNIYTGYKGYTLADSGDYKNSPVDGTTKVTRIKAYNSFISTLASNFLVSDDENQTDVWSLKYVQNEYVSQLESVIFDKYYDYYEETEEDNIQTEYLQKRYDELLSIQSTSYNSLSSFTSTMDSMSDKQFILYSPSTAGQGDGVFGYVYNILLPFSNAQSYQLTAAQKENDGSKEANNAYFVTRNNILKEIKTTDQRSAWFNGTTDYSFNANQAGVEYFGMNDGRDYLFFENNLTKTDRYESLKVYDGRYSFNGLVSKNADETYTLLANELDIDDMLAEFNEYIDYVVGAGKDLTSAVSVTPGYYSTTNFYEAGSDKEVDYSNFVYAKGNVNVNYSVATLMDPTTDAYKVMSAVNELQYAYTTDTGILSRYVGYSVDAGTTSYIKEFEYAAHEAIKEGVGTYYVCAGDYGWHLIYVTATFNGGEEVGTPDWTKTENEGTFENLFYEWIKSNDLSNSLTGKQAQIIHDFGGETTITKFEKRYQDLLDIE